MPRRKTVTRVSGDRVAEVVSVRNPTDGHARPDTRQTAASAGGTRYLTPARLDYLRGRVVSTVDPTTRELTRDIVMDTIGRVPFVSHEADRVHLTTLWPFAAWCHDRDGSFDPDRHLVDHVIRSYVQTQLGHMTQGSRDSYGSTLRRLARGDRIRPTGQRRPAQSPHTETEVRAFRSAAANAGQWRFDAETLLALTAGAGLAGNEVTRATPDWVDPRVGYTVLRVPHRSGTGVVREIPTYGATAAALRVAADGNPGYLFRSGYKCRKNVITDFVGLVAKQQKAFSTFAAVRARYYWIIQQLTAGVPFHIVCDMAGVGVGNHLPTDLLPHLPYPSLGDILLATRPRHGTVRIDSTHNTHGSQEGAL